MASAVAQYVVSLTSNGRVSRQGSISEVVAKDDKLAAEMMEEQEALQIEEGVACNAEDVPKKSGDGKLVMAEEILEGHVSWTASRCYVFL